MIQLKKLNQKIQSPPKKVSQPRAFPRLPATDRPTDRPQIEKKTELKLEKKAGSKTCHNLSFSVKQ